MANGHRPRRRLAAFNSFPFELRQVFLHRIVQLQLSLFNQGHQHRCGKGFGDRCQENPFVRCERSVRLFVDDFSFAGDKIGAPLNRPFLYGLKHNRVKPIELSLCHAMRTQILGSRQIHLCSENGRAHGQIR